MSQNEYKPSHIANYFLSKAHEEGMDITQLKLLKLVYIGYGWALAVLDRKLFSEQIEAWQHGPVIPSLYNEFKHFGKKPITQLATEFDLETSELTTPQINKGDHDALMIVGKVWEAYKYVSAWALRNKTHEDNTPWTDTYKSGTGKGSEIEPTLIKIHFQKKIQEYIEAAS